MSAAPYMPLYVADYLADTTHLTTVEHGAYVLLLMAMWRGGGKLPYDDVRLAKLALCSPDDWSVMKPTIIEFFKIKGAILTHTKITKVAAKYNDVVEKRSKAGKESGRKRSLKNNGNDPDFVQTNGQQKATNQNQNQNQSYRGISLDKSKNITSISAKAFFNGPKEVRDAVVDCYGEEGARSYVDPAEWIDGKLIPKTKYAHDKLYRISILHPILHMEAK